MDDIVRQFKGVSDGILRKVSGSPSTSLPRTLSPQRTETLALPWDEDINRPRLEINRSYNLDISRSISDEEVQDEEISTVSVNGWHSDNELNSKVYPPRVVKRSEDSGSIDPLVGSSSVPSDSLDDQSSVPPEVMISHSFESFKSCCITYFLKFVHDINDS